MINKSCFHLLSERTPPQKKQTIHLLIAEENSPLSSAFIDQSKLRTIML
jgi:hypothetical protein